MKVLLFLSTVALATVLVASKPAPKPAPQYQNFGFGQSYGGSGGQSSYGVDPGYSGFGGDESGFGGQYDGSGNVYGVVPGYDGYSGSQQFGETDEGFGTSGDFTGSSGYQGRSFESQYREAFKPRTYEVVSYGGNEYMPSFSGRQAYGRSYQEYPQSFEYMPSFSGRQAYGRSYQEYPQLFDQGYAPSYGDVSGYESGNYGQQVSYEEESPFGGDASSFSDEGFEGASSFGDVSGFGESYGSAGNSYGSQGYGYSGNGFRFRRANYVK